MGDGRDINGGRILGEQVIIDPANLFQNPDYPVLTGYRAMFAKAFGTDELTIDHAGKAIATFERTVLSGNSAYDRYQAGDKKAMTKEQARGMNVSVVTTARTDEEARKLLKFIGMPFRAN